MKEGAVVNYFEGYPMKVRAIDSQISVPAHGKQKATTQSFQVKSFREAHSFQH
jgi:hypothetical protein